MSKLLNRQSADYSDVIREIRKAKRLHTIVENRLIEIVERILPDYHSVSELQGLAGGRNDLMLFEFSGRKVVFEIFATADQVSRDLLILHKTDASVKIAIVIDKDVDGTVLARFLKENPDTNFPFIFIGELFDGDSIECSLKIKELITGDEDAKFRRMLRSKIKREDFLEACKRDGIDIILPQDISTGNISFSSVFVSLLLNKFVHMGMQKNALKKLLRWFSNPELIEYVLIRVDLGLNMFLYTDFDENMGIYSDQEWLDWIRIGYEFSKSYAYISLNALLYEIEDKYIRVDEAGKINRDITYTIGMSGMHKTPSGRAVRLSLPRNTTSIVVFVPLDEIESNNFDEIENKYRNMIEFPSPTKTLADK